MRKKKGKADRGIGEPENTVAGLDALAYDIKEDESRYNLIKDVAKTACVNSIADLKDRLGAYPNNAEIWLMGDEITSYIIEMALEDYRGNFLKKQKEMM